MALFLENMEKVPADEAGRAGHRDGLGTQDGSGRAVSSPLR
jgi:hypothetical protein